MITEEVMKEVIKKREKEQLKLLKVNNKKKRKLKPRGLSIMKR